MTNRWHNIKAESSREMRVLVVVSCRSRAGDKVQGGGVVVVFMRSTGRTN